MTFDTVLRLLALAISVGMLVAAGIKKLQIIAISAAMLVLLTVWFVFQNFTHQREIEKTKAAIAEKLVNNLWNFDRIYSEMAPTPYLIVQEALFDASDKDKRQIKSRQEQCSAFNDGTLLPTKIYYIESEQHADCDRK